MSVFHATKNFILRQSLKPQALVNSRILANPMHPLHAQIYAKFHDPTLKDKLVINFTASKNVSKKAVVRNRARRRTREAVYQALRERGYGKEGEPLAGGGREKGVTGSLSWFPTFESVNAASEELRAEVRVAVDRWLEFRERALAGGGGKGEKKKGGGGEGGGGGGQGKGKGKGKGKEQGKGATLGKEGPETKKV
ncbi:hypothetical protein B9Z19DRAFT_1120539 [Tuber borchii]|uniref:Uncharacterized protein n=1 Tax=Tuber borchii TaxID=42251 RepID=A0A2T7A434_TUBBO|nr:hypothetical protein B9Z19DRAFT_1120539 [Tuber borchii]